MKRIILVLASLLISVLSFTQVPESFNYQAIVRDAAGQEITGQLVGIQISLLQTTAVGTAVYVEQFTPTTNDFGLITLDIGTGDVQGSGVFTDIDWGAGPYFIKVEMDENGLTDYVEIGTSQLLSVPYALHAKTVENVDDADADPNNELQDLTGVLGKGTDADGNNITNLADPVNDQDAATKAYAVLLMDSLLIRIEAIESDIWTACGTVSFTYRGNLVTYGTRVGQNGTCWMDRNLGASRVALAYDDSEAYGDLFQWGRLDDGHQDRTSSNTSALSSTDDPGHSDFIIISGSPYDWRNPANDNLWQSDGGINDVCPTGWRLPTETEIDNERQSWSSNDQFGAYGSPLKLTAAGTRASNGNVYGMGDYGFYWSNAISDNNARSLMFTDSSANMTNSRRAEGSSVRCIKDD